MANASPQAPKPDESAEKRRPNARRMRFSWRDRFAGWRAHHRESSRDALRRLWQRPLGTLLTLLTLGIALALPAGLSMLVQNVHQVTGNWGGSAHLSVFLDHGVSAAKQRQLASQWQQRSGIERVKLITPEAALANYRAHADDNAILAALPNNPLPAVLVVYPVSQSPAKLASLKQRLGSTQGVDKVVFDVAWIRKLHAFVQLAQRLISVLTLVLGIGIILVINNTLQLAIESRRAEIVVMKTVGGTNGFVRRPFLYTGFWYGVGGGLVALILVMAAYAFVGQPARQLLSLYGSSSRITGLPLADVVLLPLLAGLLGLLGAFMAVSRHIDDLEPQQF